MSNGVLPAHAPAQRQLPHAVGVAAREEEGTDLFTLTLDMSTYPGGYAFAPGQFNLLYAPGVGEAAISIASGPDSPDLVSHTIHAVGRVTRWLAARQPGEGVYVRGPYGGHWPHHVMQGRHLLLVGGGVGVPPLMGVVYHALQQWGLYASVTLVAAARREDLLVYRRRYALLEGAGITVRLVLQEAPPGWPHYTGLATTALTPLAGPPGETVLLTCGPEPMMLAVARQCLDLGVPEENCYLSTERTMNCAVGLCGRCQLGPHFTCLDGPVYPFNALRPLMEVKGF